MELSLDKYTWSEKRDIEERNAWEKQVRGIWKSGREIGSTNVET